MMNILFRFISKKFIAGSTPEEAMISWNRLKSEGVNITANILGENSYTPQYVDRCIELLRYVDNVSIKPSALSTRYLNLEYIAQEAKRYGKSICLDMEDYSVKNETIRLYEKIINVHDNASIAIQTYLRDSERDVKRLLELDKKVSIRLVRGAYWKSESKKIPCPVFTNKYETDRMFHILCDKILESENSELICATYNKNSINHVIKKSQELNKEVEFQFIYGVGKSIWRDLNKQGYRVRLYTPVGDIISGMGYLLRRLNDGNRLFVLRNLLE